MKLIVMFSIYVNFLACYNAKLDGEGVVCGRPIGTSFELEESRIIAGYDLGYYRYPWYAALLAAKTIACGGALITKKAVITAAHCFKEYIITSNTNRNSNISLEDVYSVMLGVYNKCESEKTQHTFQVEKVHIHEKYKENSPYFDISMLILKEDAHIYRPICLPKKMIRNKPKEGTVPGLGTLKYHGSVPCTLHEARLLIYSDSECRDMINRTGNDPSKVVHAFCAGYMQGGIDTCQGDSGGPFQVIDEYGNYILLGIVSFGFHCANPGYLGMYTDVSQYLDWIEQKSGVKPSIDGSNFTFEPTPSGTTGRPAIGSFHTNYALRPFYRPINIYIFKKNKLERVRTKVKMYPLYP